MTCKAHFPFYLQNESRNILGTICKVDVCGLLMISSILILANSLILHVIWNINRLVSYLPSNAQIHFTSMFIIIRTAVIPADEIILHFAIVCVWFQLFCRSYWVLLRTWLMLALQECHLGLFGEHCD